MKYIILYMANIKVVDINEEDKQEETPVVEEPPIIEEANEEIEPKDEVVEEVNEEVKEEVNEEAKPKAKPKASDRVDCSTCGKNLSYKNYRYRHEKICSAEPKPVKAQAKPKAKVKMMPKPNFKTLEVSEQLQEVPVIKQIPLQQSQPTNPLSDITNHYQLLQNQYIQ